MCNNSEKKNVVCYVQRARITSWKRLVFQGKEPLFIYGSKDQLVFKNLKKNDNLWIISSIPNRPPELVAHLVIQIVAPYGDSKLKISEENLKPYREFKWIARGNKESKFFGHNDATNALLNTIFCNPKGKPRILSDNKSKWQGQFGKKLQKPTLIYPKGIMFNNQVSPGATLFEKIESHLEHSIFISYKWNDHIKRLARSLAYNLAEKGYMAWLDQLALPMTRSSKNINPDEVLLERLLQYGYKHSRFVMAIDSKNYGKATNDHKQNWTLKEWSGELDPNAKRKKLVFQHYQNLISDMIRKSETNFTLIDQNNIYKNLINI